jgi:hypothetical protein
VRNTTLPASEYVRVHFKTPIYNPF